MWCFISDQFLWNEDVIAFQGDEFLSDRGIQFSHSVYHCQVGQAIYRDIVPIWDIETGKLTDFSTHFAFSIDTQNNKTYGSGIVFFLASVGFQIPINSAAVFFGLYNKTYMNSSQNQILHVEFDSHADPDWDPSYQHVGININSVTSSILTPLNVSFHSGDIADVWISYNSTTKNFTVSWKWKSTSNSFEDTTLSYKIDLTTILPQWAVVGFAGATGTNFERHTLFSWEFNSSLDIKQTSKNNGNIVNIVVGATVSVGVFIIIVITTIFVVMCKLKQRKKTGEEVNLTSMNQDLEREAGPRRFSTKLLAMATNNFSNERKPREGGFGAVYRGYIPDIDLTIAVKKISSGSKQGREKSI
ncbi:unnamed protein product [Citrullus colocynthis]|uniref:Legume lectin domain-containing protein n=1 Tax=Citrullus colocynthis TaxID=252529 RepID=A0ABP0XQS5_9ROSI